MAKSLTSSAHVPPEIEGALLEELERSADERLRQDPDSPRLLHLRARLAARQGRAAFARACLLRAIRLDSSQAEYFNDLGDVWVSQQRHPEALAAYIHALKLAPGDPDSYIALGRALSEQGLYGEAVAVYERALRLDPDRAEAHGELGDALSARGLDDDAAQAFVHYQRALQIDPSAPAAHRRLARALDERGERQDAIAQLQKGELNAPRCVDLYVDEGELLLRHGAAELARDALRMALHLHPRDVRACRLYVEALLRLRVRDDLVGAWCSLGAALEMTGVDQDLVGAVTAYREAIAIKPDCLRALLKLGDLALRSREPQKSIEYLEAALAVDPEHPIAHINLGWALRISGQFTRGWKESAWNYASGDKRRFEQPLWDGSPLRGRTLLLWAEFALGDTIQDLRYLPLVKAAAAADSAGAGAGAGAGTDARIVVECDSRLVPLVEGVIAGVAGPGPVSHVVANKAPLPAFDVHLPLRRLPEVLRIEVSSIPNRVPYLVVDSRREAAWRERLDGGRSDTRDARNDRDSDSHSDSESDRDMTVGLVWAGDASRADARIKSASLMDFEPLADVEGVRFISLQLGPRAAELVAPPPELRVERILDDACDAADTAAVMNNLDLVITVDTMTAHLAGALGKPVWVLAAFSPAWWLWHCDGDRSLWYPTMRVFRQERAGDWESVMKKVGEALERLVLERDLED
jgi:tetratricopeptide (TPR) repeat protein